MRAESAREFPDSLDGVELRTVGREEEQCEVLADALPPFLVKRGMVEPRIVEHHDDLPPGTSADLPELLEKAPERLRIECMVFLTPREFPVPHAHCTKVPNTLPCGRVKKHGVSDFRRYPHSAGGTVLLEVGLVEHPHIDGALLQEPPEFFLKCSCFSGSACASMGRGLRSRKPRRRNSR